MRASGVLQHPRSTKNTPSSVAASLVLTCETGQARRTRVRLVAAPMVGLVLPHVPIAHALRDAGHEVQLATAADGVGAAQRAGVPVQDVAPGLTMGPLMVVSLVRHPIRVGRMVRGDEGTDGVGLMFASVNAAMAPAIIELADVWRPDLVLHEGCCTRA